MNEPSALDAYFNIGIVLLCFFPAALIFIKYKLKTARLVKVLREKEAALESGVSYVKKWQSVPEILTHVSMLTDLQESLDLAAGYFLRTVDISCASYLLKISNGYLYRVAVLGNITRGFADKSRHAASAHYRETIGDTSDEEILTEQAITGGGLDETGLSDFFGTICIPIRNKDQVLGSFCVFGTSDSLKNPETKLFVTRILDSVISATLEFKQVLVKEHKKLDAVLQSMDEGVLLFDPDYRLSLMNRTAQMFLGISDQRSYNVSQVSDIIKGSLPVQEIVTGVMDSKEPKSLQRVFVNGRYLSFMFLPVLINRETVGVGAVIHNDSEEEKLRNLREDFTAMVVHELRAPLTVIRGSADMVLKHKEKFSPQDVELFMNQIKDSAWDLLKIVNDLLDSAKIESGKFEVVKEDCNIAAVLSQEIGNYKMFTDSKNIDLILDIDDSVPIIRADREKVIQVLNNLLSNAVKFTYKGEITHMADRGLIRVGLRVQPKTVQIFVADNGPGIPNEIKKQLFNKFIQARESPISNESGTGLGLVIAKGIVEAHGGKIWVEDNVPKGSVFIFTLPFK
ncbi:MAG: hypothetical protein UW82_C0012G0007 [candidate division WWE3 bacterium GW2011_GWC2_44_9]|uniref:histidine kinase n=4 Tax=Bacteria candidate phyla TaxID=1783234 RepID=A0A0G1KML1_UNCKA|nr:MAG: hypothetical protein UW82_C0012G0007 [candidate division WWE3 bacterium GW2011_GWC2_44_9]OGC53485.1 MAG: hypothetical protein A2709_00605 [candidate division WWE3 bacterium RIFCSPHIGHO2_01_FULL_43_9]